MKCSMCKFYESEQMSNYCSLLYFENYKVSENCIFVDENCKPNEEIIEKNSYRLP